MCVNIISDAFPFCCSDLFACADNSSSLCSRRPPFHNGVFPPDSLFCQRPKFQLLRIELSFKHHHDVGFQPLATYHLDCPQGILATSNMSLSISFCAVYTKVRVYNVRFDLFRLSSFAFVGLKRPQYASYFPSKTKEGISLGEEPITMSVDWRRTTAKNICLIIDWLNLSDWLKLKGQYKSVKQVKNRPMLHKWYIIYVCNIVFID